jgi:hypothetical protein
MFSNQGYKMELEYKNAENVNDFINYYNKYFPKLDFDESG